MTDAEDIPPPVLSIHNPLCEQCKNEIIGELYHVPITVGTMRLCAECYFKYVRKKFGPGGYGYEPPPQAA
jgi:hypothetical protein